MILSTWWHWPNTAIFGVRQISCHVSQPTLSGQIRKLEDELGVMLLERTSRKVLFTQAGMLLVDQARTVLREVKVLKEMASQQGETMSGPLHIGLIPTVGPYLLPHIIPMLHQTFPKLECICMKHRPTSYWRTGQRQTRLRDPRAGERERSIIEVPLFDEPMLLLSMKITVGEPRMRTDGRSGRGKTADAGRWSLFARSGNGFLF